VSAELLQQVEAALTGELPQHLGVAVSGGGDSVALLLLLHQMAGHRGVELSVVSVDHQLRPAATREVAFVANLAMKLGLSHHICRWEGWDGTGNLQDEARRARYGMMAAWAQEKGIPAIALGHTLDDQAETVLMRLARAAGVDGLSAMQPLAQRDGMTWLRPLLKVRRETLRAYLRNAGVAWHDDPSNDDVQFDRIRARGALSKLETLGLSAEVLAQVARNMQAARGALEAQTRAAAAALAEVHVGAVSLKADGVAALPEEIERRLFVAALHLVAGGIYPPRRRSVAAALNALKQEGSATLDGCRLLRRDARFWVFREFNAVKGIHCPVEALWDGVWRLDGGRLEPGLRIAALGDAGLAACPNWRDTGLPRDLLRASPGIWAGSDLRAAPVAGWPQGWSATWKKGHSWLFDTPFSH
jgi:tRNA(Ile)-lysidine synthase